MRSDGESADDETGNPYDQPGKYPDPLFPDELPLLRVSALHQKTKKLDDKTRGWNDQREIDYGVKGKERCPGENTNVPTGAKEEECYGREAEEAGYGLNDGCDFQRFQGFHGIAVLSESGFRPVQRRRCFSNRGSS